MVSKTLFARCGENTPLLALATTPTKQVGGTKSFTDAWKKCCAQYAQTSNAAYAAPGYVVFPICEARVRFLESHTQDKLDRSARTTREPALASGVSRAPDAHVFVVPSEKSGTNHQENKTEEIRSNMKVLKY